jgi:hypothetical protein
MRKNLLLFYFLPLGVFAQNELGSWNICHVKYELNKSWSAFGEAQLRSLKFYNDFHYYEVKGGVSFRLNEEFGFSTGIGDYNTYQAGGDFVTPMINKEIRTWLQMNMYNYLHKLKIEHRYRAEQRFATNNYRNRYRYRVSFTLPIFKHKVEKKTLYLNCSNELFLGDKAPFFQRNRFFVGAGYEFNAIFSMQTGFMHQFDYRIDDETGKNFLQIALFMNIKSQRETRETVPSSEN